MFGELIDIHEPNNLCKEVNESHKQRLTSFSITGFFVIDIFCQVHDKHK